MNFKEILDWLCNIFYGTGDQVETKDFLKGPLGEAYKFQGEIELGTVHGEVCHRDGCLGTIWKVEGTCSCHTGNPPCSYCTDAPHHCDSCDWEEER